MDDKLKPFPTLKLIDTGAIDESVEALGEMVKSMHIAQGISQLVQPEADKDLSLWRSELHAKWSKQEFERGWADCEKGHQCGGSEGESYLSGYSEAYAWQEMQGHDPDEVPEDMG